MDFRLVRHARQERYADAEAGYRDLAMPRPIVEDKRPVVDFDVVDGKKRCRTGRGREGALDQVLDAVRAVAVAHQFHAGTRESHCVEYRRQVQERRHRKIEIERFEAQQCAARFPVGKREIRKPRAEGKRVEFELGQCGLASKLTRGNGLELRLRY